ncbi:MAG: response regulator [Bacteroidota bacterium]
MYKILLIEDETNLRKNICEILELNNYIVIEAENGHEGIQKIFNEQPHLVICDIMMSELDGYAVLKTVRYSKSFANLPFIFLTARTSHEDSRLGMELGADDYITKPFATKDLLNIIKTRLARNEVINSEINQKVEEYKKNLSTVYSHELYTGLTLIHMASDILINHYPQITETNLHDLFQSIKCAAERIERTLRNLQLYAEFSASGLNAPIIKEALISDSFYYKDSLVEVASNYAKSYKRTNDLKYKLSDCKLNIPIEHFLKIIEEIVDNAFKFSDDNTQVNISNSNESDKCIISVTNSGKGCEDLNSNQYLAFQQYQRDVQEQQGNGLGLYIANKLITFNNGEINIQSTKNELTVVKLIFPK